MVPHSSKCQTPLLGPQWESEEQSDVVFLVCAGGGERWRVPGHRQVLGAASPVFAAMLEGPLAEGREVRVDDVEPRAFDALLRHVYGKKVQFQSVDTALATLYAAHKYQCEALERHCISFLSSHVEASTVLVILHYVSWYYNLLMNTTATPSAPSLDVIESQEENAHLLKSTDCDFQDSSLRNSSTNAVTSPNESASDLKSKSSQKSPMMPSQFKNSQSTCDISKDFKLLVKRCLLFIDLNADKVLQQELVDELSKEELLAIVQRDTLGLSSEVVLFKVLEQWSKSVCKRNCWELSPENRRKALGNELLFSVRFLLMTSEEFMNFPMVSKLLNSEECNFLLGHILKHSVVPHSPVLEEQLSILKLPRQKPNTEFICTSHSDSCKETISICEPGRSLLVSSKPKKLFKKKKDKSKPENMRLQERKPNMSDYFFSCIACIFD